MYTYTYIHMYIYIYIYYFNSQKKHTIFSDKRHHVPSRRCMSCVTPRHFFHHDLHLHAIEYLGMTGFIPGELKPWIFPGKSSPETMDLSHQL